MICGVIDIGSNTIRLSVYEYDGVKIRKLFHKKSTAGLAGYIKDDMMDQAGIDRCCQVLQDFRETTDLLPMDVMEVFATASLRNIRNSEEAVKKINASTGYDINLLSGTEEAEYGYYGIRSMFDLDHGMGIDIGGGSTEITLFSEGKIRYASSFPIGSLKLYRKNVSKIIPTEKEMQAIKKQVKDTVGNDILKNMENCGDVVAVGGSVRGILKIANTLFDLSEENLTLDLQQLEMIRQLLRKENKMTRMILQACPDRIHTIIPGLVILMTILKETKERKLKVCPFGVREGYLFKKILCKEENLERIWKS